MSAFNREQWLTEAANLILEEILMPASEQCGYEYPNPPFKVAIGGVNGRPTKVLGHCTPTARSAGGFSEIVINNSIDDPVRALDVLTHELIHSIDDCESGHKRGAFFGRVARKAGLEGKLTATYAGEELKAHLQSIADILGEFPHKAVDYSDQPKKGSRMKKVECGACGWNFRTSAKQIERITLPVCMCCGRESTLTIEG